MRTEMFTCFFLFLLAESYAQNKAIIAPVADQTVGAFAIKKTITPVKNASIDSISNMKNIVQQSIYSEKQWRLHLDSLVRIPSVNIPQFSEPGWSKKEVSLEKLIDQVKQDYRVPVSKQFSTPASVVKDAVPSSNTLGSGLPAPPDLADTLQSLSQLKLPADRLGGLSPLSGNQIQSSYVKQLDSIRQMALSKGRLVVEEKKISAEHKILTFKEKLSWRDKTYFEGILGISGNQSTVFQASPAWGYHFMNGVSIGLGPAFLIQKEEQKMHMNMGVRSFVKAEFFKSRAYVQVEDMMGGTNTQAREVQSLLKQQTLMAGGGYLLPVSSTFSLNLMVLYVIESSLPMTHEWSPLVFRLGISSIKIGKQ